MDGSSCIDAAYGREIICVMMEPNNGKVFENLAGMSSLYGCRVTLLVDNYPSVTFEGLN